MRNKQDHTLAKFQRLRTEESQILNACLAAYTRLSCLKKVYEKVRLKELRLAKQGLLKLKAKEAKTDSNLEEVETTYTPVVDSVDNLACLLPLTNPFVFGSFSILPNPFSSNTPIPFL